MMNLLVSYRLSIDAKNIYLHLGTDTDALIGEATIKRMAALACSFDRSYDVISQAQA